MVGNNRLCLKTVICVKVSSLDSMNPAFMKHQKFINVFTNYGYRARSVSSLYILFSHIQVTVKRPFVHYYDTFKEQRYSYTPSQLQH